MAQNEMYGPFLPNSHPAAAQTRAKGKQADAHEFTLSRDPKKAIREMMDTMDALHTLYTKENEALKKSNTQRFLELQQKKIQIAKDYQSGTRQLLERRKEFENTSEALKARLIEKQEAFNEITATNLKLLDRVKGSINRLNDRIMDGVRKEAQKDSLNYKYNGSLLQNDKPVSIGVSESA